MGHKQAIGVMAQAYLKENSDSPKPTSIPGQKRCAGSNSPPSRTTSRRWMPWPRAYRSGGPYGLAADGKLAAQYLAQATACAASILPLTRKGKKIQAVPAAPQEKE